MNKTVNKIQQLDLFANLNAPELPPFVKTEVIDLLSQLMLATLKEIKEGVKNHE